MARVQWVTIKNINYIVIEQTVVTRKFIKKINSQCPFSYIISLQIIFFFLLLLFFTFLFLCNRWRLEFPFFLIFCHFLQHEISPKYHKVIIKCIKKFTCLHTLRYINKYIHFTYSFISLFILVCHFLIFPFYTRLGCSPPSTEFLRYFTNGEFWVCLFYFTPFIIDEEEKCRPVRQRKISIKN